jgi:hypothetical protein
MTRSGYLKFLAQKDANAGGYASEGVQPAFTQTKPLDFTREVYEFFVRAMPALEEYEASKKKGDPKPGAPATVVIPPGMGDSELWQFFLLERQEILDLKWLESEKSGKDIGLNTAVKLWLQLHRNLWLDKHKPGE